MLHREMIAVSFYCKSTQHINTLYEQKLHLSPVKDFFRFNGPRKVAFPLSRST